MFFSGDKKKRLVERAAEVDRQAAARPYEPVRVDPEVAEHMGAFVEDAVDPRDFLSLEPGALDDIMGLGLFGPGRKSGKREGK
ncbi:MAG: hypothetical protein LBP95_07650 [Deltaproteobacteria bacterium]|jgi:hypothetical protein|nr:hypothetical protein [Deltaproteobacteria bacterium]